MKGDEKSFSVTIWIILEKPAQSEVLHNTGLPFWQGAQSNKSANERGEREPKLSTVICMLKR